MESFTQRDRRRTASLPRVSERAEQALRDTMYWFHLKEADVVDLASGFVPASVRAMCLFALDTEGDLRRHANKPRRSDRKTSRKQVSA
jgi:hypothetical protein